MSDLHVVAVRQGPAVGPMVWGRAGLASQPLPSEWAACGVGFRDHSLRWLGRRQLASEAVLVPFRRMPLGFLQGRLTAHPWLGTVVLSLGWHLVGSCEAPGRAGHGDSSACLVAIFTCWGFVCFILFFENGYCIDPTKQHFLKGVLLSSS